MIHKHGLSIGMERINNQLFISIKAVGTLTHEDYQTITPFIEGALAEVRSAKVDVLFDATELDGWELRAAWDDFKLGLKHGSDFNRIAIYGNRGWQALAAKVGNWFVSGEVRYFDHADAALAWLTGSGED